METKHNLFHLTWCLLLVLMGSARLSQASTATHSKADASATVIPENARPSQLLANESTLSWETHTSDNVFIHHQNGEVRIGSLNEMSAENNASWKMIPGLANTKGVSFQSASDPNRYLAYQGNAVTLAVNTDSEEFKANATFYIRMGLADDAKASFESYSQPDKFLRHKNSVLYLEAIANDQDRADATFSAYTGTISTKNWKKTDNKLWTTWGEQINDPDQVLRDYPRPQLKRSDNWINLNGLWKCKKGNTGEPAPFGENLDRDILVPFPIEASLSGVKQHWDRVWYRKVFTVPSDWDGQQVKLNFGAVDWESEIFVNGQSVLVHRGGFDPFSVDITPYLNGGSNELIVRVYDPTDSESQPVGKQRNRAWSEQDNIFYTPSTGIWQTVWLEAVPTVHIDNIKIVPNIDNSTLQVIVNTSGDASGLRIDAQAKNGGDVLSAVSGNANTQLTLSIPNQKLWSPDDPFLYDLSVQLKSGQTTVDAIESYFGMRKISLGKHNGVTAMMLNNEFLFQMGPLDQGFWPDGLYTPPSEEAIKFDLQGMKDLGYNMVRKHIKVEPARWYYNADKIGLIVWQDMPNGWNINAKEQHDQFELELDRMIDALWNVPSIVMWVVFNEQWGMYDQERITNNTVAKDPSRLINGNSACCGGSSVGGDLNDQHYYSPPNSPAPDANRAVVNGEYGGLVLPKPGHMWYPDNFSTWARVVNSDAEFTDVFVDYCNINIALRETRGMSAAVVTQWTDVEAEINGNYTYDRKVFKGDYNRIREALRSTYDESKDANITPPPGYVAWASYNIGGHFIRHQNGASLIDNNVAPKEDAYWKMVPGLAGQGVSFQSRQSPNSYLRHRDGRMFLDANDGKPLFAEDATFIVRPGLADNTQVSFQSLNFPDRYIRHISFILYTTPIVNDTDRKDATFAAFTGNELATWVSHNEAGHVIRHQNSRAKIDSNINPVEDSEWKMVFGLAGTGVSFQSVNFPDHYLRHKENAIYLEKFDGKPLFREDATFLVRPGLADASKASFESFNYPGNFIRHRQFLLYSEPIASSLDRADATFSKAGSTAASVPSLPVLIQDGFTTLYPNPLTDQLNIRGIPAHSTVKIYDRLGILVLTKQFDKVQPEYSINTSSLRSGLYLLKTGDTEMKFIKQ